MKLGDRYNFVSLWEGSLHGIKGALLNKETGKLYRFKNGNTHFFADPSKLKKEGITILRGKKRNNFLREFGWAINQESRVLRRRKR